MSSVFSQKLHCLLVSVILVVRLLTIFFSKVIEQNTKSSILTSHISDHQAIYISTNFKFNKHNKTKYINVETKDDASLNTFINE